MARAHSCLPWERMGIPCPSTLIEAVESRKRKQDPELEEPVIVGDKLKKEERKKIDIVVAIPARRARIDVEFRGVSQEEWEALLLEIARRTAQQTIDMPEHVPVPARYAEAARARGADPKMVGLWVAAVAAALAAALAFGPKGPLALPEMVRGIMSSARTQGRGGFQNNAAAELEILLEGGIMRRLGDGVARTGAGEFFPGTEG